MSWTCSNCKQEAWHLVSRIDHKGNVDEICDKCGLEGNAGVPDAYLPRLGMTFQALCDDNGKPIPIMSKRHKKEVMDKLGVRECPERLSPKTWVEGTRDNRRKSFEQDRPAIRETYKRYLENVRRGR